MSAAASTDEFERRSDAGNNTDLNEVSDPHLAHSLDVLSSTSPPTLSGPVIAVDLDDVLSQTNLMVAEWHNEVHGTNMDLSDFYYYYYWKNPYWGGLTETFDKVRNFYASRKIFEAPPVPGAREGVQALRNMGYRLIIVTARTQDVKEASWKWVEKWFPGIFDSVVCTGQFKDASKTGHEVTTKLSKAQVCTDLKARLLIDDSSENAIQVGTSSSPTPVLLFGHYEWNKRISSGTDAVDAMVFDTRLAIEGGREFWKEERLEIPEGAPIERVRDWGEVVHWIKNRPGLSGL